MKLRKLTIHNIASIEHAEIDFTAYPLSDTELFLITGNTGAGKSTILDAICLALYATTPRMKNTKKPKDDTKQDESQEWDVNDTRQLMRRNTKDAYSLLTFLGSDGNEYEALWAVERKRKNVSRRWQLKNLTHPEASPDEGTGADRSKDRFVQAAIMSAVGLDFSQFCRTTMLAQGEFTRFLNSEDKEKADILEKVTGTGIYSRIGAKVYEMTSNFKRDWISAKEKIEGVQVLTGEQIAEKMHLLAQIDADQKECADKLDTDKKKLLWWEQDAKLANDKAALEAEYNAVKALIESEAYKANERVVSLWDSTADVRRLLDIDAQCQSTILAQESALNKHRLTYRTLLCGLAFAEAKVKADSAAIGELEQQLPPEERALTIDRLRIQRDGSNALLLNLRVAYERLEMLKNARVKYAESRQKLIEQKQQIEQLQKHLQTIEPAMQVAEAKYESCKKILDKQKDTINSFAKTLRERLQQGDTCPICGQTVCQPVPHEQVWLQLVQDAQTAYDAAYKEYKSLSDQVRLTQAELKTQSQSYARNEQQHNADTSVQDATNSVIDYCNKCGLPTELLQMPLQEQRLQDVVLEQGKAVNARLKHLNNIINILEQIQSLATDLKVKTDRLSLIRNTNEAILSRMPYWTVETVGQPEDVTNLAGKMQQLQSDVFTASNLKNEALKQKSEANQGLEMFFAENKDLTRDAVMSLNRHTAAEIMRLRDNLNRQKNTLEQKKTLLDNICRQTQEHQNNKPDFAEDENPAVISERLRLNEQQAAELSEKKGAVNQLLNADAEAKKKLQSYIEDANKKRQVYEQWAMLNTLIGDKEGTKFRKIAQGYILSNLVSAANIYMQRLTNRYTLHTLAGTFIIMVTDAYQGYVARPVSTISGGESFLVSLALALALSDIGQNLRVETLFIDEGFGTLSGEPLQRAIETLQSLHKHAGRQVGIISHIEEVRERIPVQIRVHRDGNNSAGTVEIVADEV